MSVFKGIFLVVRIQMRATVVLDERADDAVGSLEGFVDGDTSCTGKRTGRLVAEKITEGCNRAIELSKM